METQYEQLDIWTLQGVSQYFLEHKQLDHYWHSGADASKPSNSNKYAQALHALTQGIEQVLHKNVVWLIHSEEFKTCQSKATVLKYHSCEDWKK